MTEASLLRLPYGDGTFAGVLAECVRSTTFQEGALNELRRVTAGGGVLLLSDVMTTEPAWQPGELEALVVSTGYVVDRTWDETRASLT